MAVLTASAKNSVDTLECDIMERAVSVSVLFIRSATLFCAGLYSTVVWCTIETLERLLNNIPRHYQSFNFLSSCLCLRN